MPITVVSSGSNGAEGTNTTTHNLTVPAVADGDVLWVSVALASSTTVTPSALFSSVAPTVSTRSGLGHHVWGRAMAASESGTVVNFVTGSTLKVALQWVVLRGVALPLDLSGTTSVNGVTATTFSVPAVTPVAGKVALQFVGVATASVNPPTVYTPPSGITVQVFNGTGGTTGRSGGAVGTNLTENGTTGNSWTVNASSTWSGVTAMVAAAGAAPEPVALTRSVDDQLGLVDAVTAERATTVGPAFSISSTKTLGGTLIPPNDSRFRLGGGDNWAFGATFPDTTMYQPAARYPRTWGYPRSAHYEFGYTGRYFEVYFKHVSNTAHIRVLLNGVPLTDLMQTTGAGTGGNLYYYKVDLGEQVSNARVTVETNGMPWGGIVPDTGATLTGLPAHTMRVVVQGDSTSDGSNENTGGNSGTWALRLAHKRGWTDLWNLAIGGTGFTAPGSAVSILDRMQDVLLPAINLHFLFAGGNDGNTSIATAVQSYLDQFKAAHPTTRIIIVGTWGPTQPASTARQARDAELEQAAINNGLEFASTITGRVRSKTGALLTTKTPVISSTADQTAYVGSDNVHPNDPGHERLATWMDEAVTVLDSAPAALQTFLTDTVAGSDTVAAARTAAADLTDTVTAADVVTTTTSKTAELADATTATDLIGVARSVSLTDSVSAADTLSPTSARTANLADQIAATDLVSVAAAGAQSTSLADTVAGTDELSATRTATRTVTDTLNGSDALTVDRTTSLTDALPISDTAARSVAQNRQITDALPAAETLTVEKAGLASAEMADTLPGTDAVAVENTRPRTLTDTLVTADTVTVDRSSGNTNTVVDPLTVLDEIEATWVRAAVITDVLPVADAVVGAANRSAVLVDTVELADLLMLFAGPTRNLDLTLTVGRSRYASTVDRGRYEVRVP